MGQGADSAAPTIEVVSALPTRPSNAPRWLHSNVPCGRDASSAYHRPMCRNIHTLFNYEPHATEEEVRDAALQYVRKISGFTKPSRANEEAFARAVDEVAEASARLLDALVTNAPPRDRDVEAERKRARAAERFSLAR